MLKTKHRFLIILSITLAIAGASLVNQIAIMLNINPKDPLFFATQNSALFQYNDGFSNNKTITITVNELNPAWSNVSITIDSTEYLSITPDGFYNNTEYYTIFWLHVPNPLISGTSFGVVVGRSFNITDPIGLIGPKNANYTAIIDRKLVLWPLEPGLHGAQYSFQVTFYNQSNSMVIAQGIYDSTCGMLFVLKGGSPYVQVQLLETTYPISRNRMMSWPWALGLSVGVTVIAYVLMKKKWQLDAEQIREITLLMAAGVAVTMVDIYVDVWLYAIFGFMGNLLLHIGVAIGLLAICFYQNYKIKWTIPAFLEVAFLLPMVLVVGDNYVPHLTAFMGLIITWLIMVYISGYPSQPKSKTKLGRLLSEFF
jgi:hypothetical protein